MPAADDVRMALDTIHRDHGERLVAYGLALTGSRARAIDLVQRGAQRAVMRGRRRSRTDAAHVARHMRMLYLRHARRARGSHDSPAPTEEPAVRPTPLESAWADLPPRVRVATVMSAVEEVPWPQIARALRVREATARRWTDDGRAAVAAHLGIPEYEPEWMDLEPGR